MSLLLHTLFRVKTDVRAMADALEHLFPAEGNPAVPVSVQPQEERKAPLVDEDQRTIVISSTAIELDDPPAGSTNLN